MPRLPTLRTRVLQELARQLRFESADAARRQLARAEELALQLLVEDGEDVPAGYPEEWVVFRITGLRTDGGDGGVVVREALLGDLPALIDRLSAASKITERDLAERKGGVWLDAEAVCARWSVSRKTLERYRRLGLVSRRVTLGRGRERVVYGEPQVLAFERAHAERVREAGAFVRRDDRERAWIVTRAARYHARFGWSLFMCARRIAVRDGRSVEGVRRLLHAHERRAERPIFDEPGVLDAERRGLIERTARRGGSMRGAAERVRKSRATAYRVAAAAHAARLRGADLHVPAGGDAVFERLGTAETVLGHRAARTVLGAHGALSVGELLRMAGGIEPEAAAWEQARATACWLLIWKAERAVRGLPRHGARTRSDGRGVPGLDQIKTWLLWASRLRAEMVRSQLPLLVRAIESQAGRDVVAIPGHALREMCEAGLEALIDAGDRFDPFKGGRLAAPAGITVGRALSQWLRQGREELGPAGRAMARVDLDRVELPDFARRVHGWQEWLEAPVGVRERIGELGATERRVLELRYGWDGGPPRTLEETAKELETTPTRIAAMHRRWVGVLAFGAPARKKRAKKGGSG